MIKSSSIGPVLFTWNVVGKNGNPFKSWKFRSMVPDAGKIKIKLEEKNEMVGPVFKIKDDPRINDVSQIISDIFKLKNDYNRILLIYFN